jgi:hypothetical protein
MAQMTNEILVLASLAVQVTTIVFVFMFKKEIKHLNGLIRNLELLVLSVRIEQIDQKEIIENTKGIIDKNFNLLLSLTNKNEQKEKSPQENS